MQGLLKEQAGVVEHTFKSRPDNRQDSAISPFESTTLPLWLVPRLLTAAAVLQVRCSYSSAGEKESRLSSSLVKTAQDLICLSLQAPSQGPNIRLLLLESLEASLRAIAYSGRPSFLPSSAPPISLLPKKGEYPNLVSYFPASKAKDYQPPQKRFGDGINRLWMKEDHTMFEPDVKISSPADQSTFARALLLLSCHLCSQVATIYQAELTDIGNTAISLLLSNWKWDTLQHPLVLPYRAQPDHLNDERVKIATSILSGVISRAISSPPYEQLSILIVKRVAAFFTREISPREVTIRSLKNAVPLLRKDVTSTSEEAVTIMQSCTMSLIDELRGSPTSTNQTKTLALEALLFLLTRSKNPRVLLQEKERQAILAVFKLEVIEGGDQDLQWINDEQRKVVTEVLRLLEEHYEQKEAIGDSVDNDLVTPAQCLAIQGFVDGERAPDVMVALRKGKQGIVDYGHLFCASAGSLRREKGVLVCRQCDTHGAEITLEAHFCDFAGLPTVHQLFKVAKAAFDDTNGKAADRENVLHLLCRSISHAKPEQVMREVIRQDVCTLVLRSLIDKSRKVRILAGKLTAAFVNRYTFSGALVLATIGAKVEIIFQIYRDTLQRGRPKAKEAALLGLARLGYNQQSDIRAQTLLLLILQLGSDSLQKSLAYTIITQLANHDRVTVYQLVAPFLDIISAEVIDRIHSAPTLFLEMLQLTNQNQSKFLQSTLQYTLPRVLEKRDDKTLSLIARGIGQDIQTMCFNSTPAILKYFLMQPPHKRDEGIRMFIETVRGSGANDINQRSLLKSYFVELLGHLVIRLGDPEQKKAALAGLHHIRSILNDRQGNVKSTTAKEMALSAFLKDEILAILSWINDDLMNAHGKTTIVHKYMVAESIGALVEVVGQTISVVTPQLMATMNTTMQVKELMLPTLHSWHAFITRLGYSVVGPFIGQTAAALLSSWPRFGPNEKKVASRILSYIVMDSMQELKLFLLQDFPNLEELRGDIPAICDKLASIGSSSAKRPEQRLQHILDRAANENSSICGQALAELKTFLNREKDYVQRITTGNTFDPVVGKIVHILFATVARDDESESLRDSCLENLGILGAIDPDRFKHDKADQTNDLLQDFNDKDEISDFAMHLVRDVLVSAFKATNDTKHQATLAYAIQELLKLAGFSTALLAVNGNYTTNVKVVSLRVKQRFSKFPPEMLDIIAPLLESKYSVHLGDMSVREMPIYRNSSSYKDWVQHWTNHLIVTVTGDHAKSLFGIFRSVIRDHDLGIAQYILPHLVLNILIMGTKEQSWEIRQELVAVLEDQVTPSTDFEPERRLLSAQVVFGLLDHVNVWMRRRTQHRSKQSRRHQAEIDSAVSRVQSTMRTISQELMAIASLKCRAYARSLLNFEQEIRVLRKNGKEDSDLQEHYENMHLIYANLDEPDGMEGISTRIVSSSLEHQIREHESTGRWTSAQSCWEVKIQEKPDDLTLHLGLLRCLRNLGHYDTMRTHIRGVLAVNPEWEKMVDSFYVEGCCILSDWAEVKKRLNKEGAGPSSPSHATARVLLAMHEGDQACLQKSIKDARSLLGKPLIAAGKNSYVSVYESVTQLHMLHELGMISEALGVSRSTASSQKTLCNLSKALEARLASTLPSFRTREPLLSVRRSAFSTRKQDDFRAEIGQSWIFSSKIARRTGHTQTAYSAAMQASQWKAPFAFIQKAKLLAMGDQSQAALQELKIALNSEDFANAADKTASYKESLAHAMLFSARLNDQTGRSRPNDLIQQYRTCAKVDPASEKMWYYLGHYYDQCSERDVANNIQIVNIFTQHLNTCKYLLKSASCGTKFFYRSLPRVLTIWFDCGDDQSILAAQRPKSTTKQQPLAGDVENKVASFRMMNDLVRKFVDKLAPYQVSGWKDLIV
jgi:serine/threonine-protein kinase ATR